MTHTTHNETPPPGSERVSGQTSGLDTRDHTTSLDTLQHRIHHIRLRLAPGACIALELPNPIDAQLLTIEEARQLIGALADLIGDLENDLRERRRAFLQMIDAADASCESYHSKL